MSASTAAAILAADTPRRPRPVPLPAGAAVRPAPAPAAATQIQVSAPARASSLLGARPGRKKEEQRARRDHSLAVIIDDIHVGPLDFAAPPGDPHFTQLEPYTGIRLRNRTLPFDDFQLVMTGRHFVSISMLYALVNKVHAATRGGSDAWAQTDGSYNLPLDGDWVVIGVLAEKGQVKVSQGRRHGRASSSDEDDPTDGILDPKDGQKTDKAKKKKEEEGKDKPDRYQPYHKPHQPRKYMGWKIVDYGNKTSAPGADGRTRGTDSGDCVLNLQLFEADQEPEQPKPDESRNHVRAEIRAAIESKECVKTYRGGSRGAFEKYWKEREGVVVAIVNPRIMRRGTVNQANYDKTLLSITPKDAASIHVIGRALDHGQCKAHRQDGTRCNAWVDARTGVDVCDYHLERGITATRRGRQEFAVGTSGGAGPARTAKSAGYDADDLFGFGGRGGGGANGSSYKGKRWNGGAASQPQHWDQSVEQGMGAGLGASSSGKARGGAFVVEGAGTWAERSGQPRADGRGPEVGDINFDVTSQYGRLKEERKERLRHQAAADELEAALRQKAGTSVPRPSQQRAHSDAPVEADVEAGGDDKDWMLQGSSTASQALREAMRVLTYKQELAAAAAAQQGGKKGRKSRVYGMKEDALLAAALVKNAKERHRAHDGAGAGAGPAKRPRWAYSAEAIQKMGFDPLAGAPGRAGAVPVWKESEGVDQASKSKLLARVSGPTTDLPPPSLRKSAKKRALAEAQAREGAHDPQRRPLNALDNSTTSRSEPAVNESSSAQARTSVEAKTHRVLGGGGGGADSGSELDWMMSDDDDY